MWNATSHIIYSGAQHTNEDYSERDHTDEELLRALQELDDDENVKIARKIYDDSYEVDEVTDYSPPGFNDLNEAFEEVEKEVEREELENFVESNAGSSEYVDLLDVDEIAMKELMKIIRKDYNISQDIVGKELRDLVIKRLYEMGIYDDGRKSGAQLLKEYNAKRKEKNAIFNEIKEIGQPFDEIEPHGNLFEDIERPHSNYNRNVAFDDFDDDAWNELSKA